MFAYCTPGTWITFVAPVPRMMFTSDCMPTTVKPSLQLVLREIGTSVLDVSYCTSPLLQHCQAAADGLFPAGCGSSCRRRITFWSLLKVFATCCQNSGVWSLSGIVGCSVASCVPAAPQKKAITGIIPWASIVWTQCLITAW